MNAVETGGLLAVALGLLELIKLLVAKLQVRNGNGKVTRAQCLEAQAALRDAILNAVAKQLSAMNEALTRLDGRVDELRLWQAAENARRKNHEK